MICMAANKQRLWYANPTGELMPLYEVDDSGNVIFDIIDGEKVPRKSGKWEQKYTDPIEFYGNINSGDVGISEHRPYGVSMGEFEAKLVMQKGDVPINELTLIWYMNEPKYKVQDNGAVEFQKTPDGNYLEDEHGNLVSTKDTLYYVDPKSADYRVKRVPPCLDEIDYLLVRNDNNGEDD